MHNIPVFSQVTFFFFFLKRLNILALMDILLCVLSDEAFYQLYTFLFSEIFI